MNNVLVWHNSQWKWLFALMSNCLLFLSFCLCFWINISLFLQYEVMSTHLFGYVCYVAENAAEQRKKIMLITTIIRQQKRIQIQKRTMRLLWMTSTSIHATKFPLVFLFLVGHIKQISSACSTVFLHYETWKVEWGAKTTEKPTTQHNTHDSNGCDWSCMQMQ